MYLNKYKVAEMFVRVISITEASENFGNIREITEGIVEN
jgi:hypothetical protein